MHQWGDGWPLWEKMGEMVDRAYELITESKLPGSECYCLKEKYGTLRWYYSPGSDEDAAKYRKIYETLVEEYPELRHEILNMADGFREYLIGIVPEAECDHEGTTWQGYSGDGKDERWCGTCGKDMGAEED